MTAKYHQHAQTLLKNPKNHDILTIVCRNSVKIIFPLRCSHFIFLDETAVEEQEAITWSINVSVQREHQPEGSSALEATVMRVSSKAKSLAGVFTFTFDPDHV